VIRFADVDAYIVLGAGRMWASSFMPLDWWRAAFAAASKVFGGAG
jgi:hypothetical protein